MFIAKMTTNYPDFHGEGYYNFLVSDNEDELNEKIIDNSHDFSLAGREYYEGDIDDMMEEYPSKKDLNEALFNV